MTVCVDEFVLNTGVHVCICTIVETMKLKLNSKKDAEPCILAVFSIDGAGLNSTSTAVFGFMRILNQVMCVSVVCRGVTVVICRVWCVCAIRLIMSTLH